MSAFRGSGRELGGVGATGIGVGLGLEAEQKLGRRRCDQLTFERNTDG